MKERLRDMH